MSEINKPSGSEINKIWASSGVISVPADSKIATGWVVEAPPHQTENYLNNKHDTILAHANQHGGFVWDSETEYIGGKSWTQGSNGVIYRSKVTSVGQNPTTDVSESYWTPILDGNKKLNASAVSPYMLTLLDDTTPSIAQTTLGGTTVGKGVFTATTPANARSILEIALGFEISLSPSLGYVRLPNWASGFTMAWGRTGVNALSYSTLDLASIFNNEVLNVTCSDNNTSTNIDIPSPRSSFSGKTITLVNPFNIAMNINWKAVGN